MALGEEEKEREEKDSLEARKIGSGKGEAAYEGSAG